jgi:hypothetical protein
VKKLVSLTFLPACPPLALATSACAADSTSGASASQTSPMIGVPKAGQNSATKPLGPITHQVDLYIPGSASLKLSGTFLVRVRTPKGKPLTSLHLVVGLYGLWKDSLGAQTHHVLGSAEDMMRGKAVIKYELPADLVGRTIM